jgi:hypothetical protein
MLLAMQQLLAVLAGLEVMEEVVVRAALVLQV